MKADLDTRMERTLKAMARRRGEDHRAVTLACAVSFAPVCRHCAFRTKSRKPCLHTVLVGVCEENDPEGVGRI
jgi:hypothetical protein